ncbi:MAG: hypothetical protein ACI84C_002917, partial [Flavobacteriales bacterium]
QNTFRLIKLPQLRRLSSILSVDLYLKSLSAITEAYAVNYNSCQYSIVFAKGSIDVCHKIT